MRKHRSKNKTFTLRIWEETISGASEWQATIQAPDEQSAIERFESTYPMLITPDGNGGFTRNRTGCSIEGIEETK